MKEKINPFNLMSLYQIDKSQIVEIFSITSKQLSSLKEKIKKSYEQKNMQELKEHLHLLKGTFASLALQESTLFCRELEERVKKQKSLLDIDFHKLLKIIQSINEQIQNIKIAAKEKKVA